MALSYCLPPIFTVFSQAFLPFEIWVREWTFIAFFFFITFFTFKAAGAESKRSE